MKRLHAYLWIGLSYIVACAAGYGVWLLSNAALGTIWALLLGDIAATVMVWGFGLLFRNSSFYDPYWSLMPWVILLFLAVQNNALGANFWVLFAAMTVWSWRLTVNWAYTCRDITTQDWRYVKFKQDNKPLMWHIINFFGINMIPTLIVFCGLLPAIALTGANAPFTPWVIVGAVVILAATGVETVADIQMHRFLKTAKKGQVMTKGIWRFSRHPNYFGEISVWLGVYLCMLAVSPSQWYFGFGVLVMIALFCGISIPMAEKRQLARRPAYAAYRKRTSMLLLLPPRSVTVDQAQENAGEI